MLEKDKFAAEPVFTNPAHGGTAIVGNEPSENNGRVKPDRKQRIVRAPRSQSEVGPVRIGRLPQAANIVAPSLSPVINPAMEIEPWSVSPPTEPAAMSDVLGGIESRRDVHTETIKAIADLHTKFGAMEDSFHTLEAHVSVGLAKSIAGMIHGEVSAIEGQIAARYRYRTRFWLALCGAFALAGMIVVDHFYPFFDRVAAFAGY